MRDSARPTPRVRGTKRCAAALLFGCALASAPAQGQLVGADSDSDLFRTNVPPNVLMIVDNSKSMNDSVWHPDYGLVDGRIQVFEINTNPVLVPPPWRLDPRRWPSQARSAALLVDAFRALDPAPASAG